MQPRQMPAGGALPRAAAVDAVVVVGLAMVAGVAATVSRRIAAVGAERAVAAVAIMPV